MLKQQQQQQQQQHLFFKGRADFGHHYQLTDFKIKFDCSTFLPNILCITCNMFLLECITLNKQAWQRTQGQAIMYYILIDFFFTSAFCIVH